MTWPWTAAVDRVTRVDTVDRLGLRIHVDVIELLEIDLQLETLLSITVVMTMGSVLLTGWLATVGYRAYRRRGTRLLKYATSGLALIAVSRVFWLLTGYSYVVENYLSVRMILSIQILRSTTLFVGFVLVIYAIYTHG
jgi:hypothetical protein